MKSGRQRRRNRLSELLAIGLLVAPTACILVVNDDPEKLSNRCKFSGDTTTSCGICIARSCQTQVDACCASKSCREDGAFTLTKPLELLDQCSTGSTYSCRVPSLVSESSTEGAIFSCIQSSCASECGTGDGGTTVTDSGKRDSTSTTSRTNCSSSSTDSCSCTGSPPFNDTPCDIVTVKNSLCCANLGWPGSGLRCACERWECRQISTGCECGAFVTGPNTTCTGSYCCSSGSSCKCGNTACRTYETEVSSCGVDDQYECSSANDKVVSSCAVPN